MGVYHQLFIFAFKNTVVCLFCLQAVILAFDSQIFAVFFEFMTIYHKQEQAGGEHQQADEGEEGTAEIAHRLIDGYVPKNDVADECKQGINIKAYWVIACDGTLTDKAHKQNAGYEIQRLAYNCSNDKKTKVGIVILRPAFCYGGDDENGSKFKCSAEYKKYYRVEYRCGEFGAEAY